MSHLLGQVDKLLLTKLVLVSCSRRVSDTGPCPACAAFIASVETASRCKRPVLLQGLPGSSA